MADIREKPASVHSFHHFSDLARLVMEPSLLTREATLGSSSINVPLCVSLEFSVNKSQITAMLSVSGGLSLVMPGSLEIQSEGGGACDCRIMVVLLSRPKGLFFLSPSGVIDWKKSACGRDTTSTHS